MPRPRVKCEDCLYWDRHNWPPDRGIGECRIDSPKGIESDLAEYKRIYRAQWPITLHKEGCWCGEPVDKGGGA